MRAGPSTAAVRLPQDSPAVAERRIGSQSQADGENIPGRRIILEEEKTKEDSGTKQGDTAGSRKA